MTDSHLINTVRFLRRRGPQRVAAHNMGLDIPFPNFNGEMAQMLAEAEWERALEERLDAPVSGLASVPIFNALARELTLRLCKAYREGVLARRRRPLTPTNSW